MGSSAGRVPAFLPHYRAAYLLLDSKPQRKESASGVFEQRGVSYGQDRAANVKARFTYSRPAAAQVERFRDAAAVHCRTNCARLFMCSLRTASVRSGVSPQCIQVRHPSSNNLATEPLVASGMAMDAAALGGAEQGARRSARTMPSPVRSPPAIQQQD
eukprot:scaffold21481_cov80-Phaeocystis_antarctica.AAC.1